VPFFGRQLTHGPHAWILSRLRGSPAPNRGSLATQILSPRATITGMRMFVAVVPPPEVLEDIATFLEPRRDADDAALRWTDAYQWHLTLAFFAEVPDRRLDDLLERLGRAAARRPAVSVRLRGAGAFPSADRARVLWLGAVPHPADGLARLAEGSRAAAVRAGVEVEGGRFRAHLTLARTRRPLNATRWLRVLDAFDGREWQVEHLELIASHLGEGRDKRPRYETMGTFLVGGGGIRAS
jgi:RNA 2',3'-cyclic 3'-phosphodiesterase